MKKLVASLFVLYLCIQPIYAQDKITYTCPATIASIDKHDLSVLVTGIMKNIYKELGCDTNFIALPGRRGIQSFNSGKIDGEVFRLKIAEKLYESGFLSSKTPLFISNNSLWTNPNNINRAIGFSIGVIWQEEYMEGKAGIAFSNYKKMFDAYNRGSISGFLNNDIIIAIKNNQKSLKPIPVNQKKLLSEPLYHYLKPEYKAFMDVFDQHLIEKKPFLNLKRNSN